MHYMIQTTVAALEAATLTIEGQKAWQAEGGDRYVGWYPSGQAIFSEVRFGSPVQHWFEVQVSDPGVLTDIGFPAASLMRDEVRTNGLLRGYLKSQGRALIRNSGGVPVGTLPDRVIGGTDPKSSFLAGEDPDDAQELPDLL